MFELYIFATNLTTTLMKYTCKVFYCLFLASMLAGCSRQNTEQTEQEGVNTVLPELTNEVTVMPLRYTTFNHELVSNGKVTAHEMADLYFRTSEVIARVWVKNGDYVRRGQKLAELDLFALQNRLEQARVALAGATLEMKDVLIGQGYDPDNFEAVPEDVLELAGVRSGYLNSKAQYAAAEAELKQATLVAPFDGVVANLFDKRGNMPQTGKPFCSIVGSGNMEVDFTVLENELMLVKVGDEVEVVPYAAAGKQYKGEVTAVNPLVDADGMVRVKARIAQGRGLFEGMNVRVSVKRGLQNQLVVPKSAVVIRQGKQVMFTHKDGKAMWNYVQPTLENMDEYVIMGENLEEGMEVIVSGNLNLAHEAPVKKIKN